MNKTLIETGKAFVEASATLLGVMSQQTKQALAERDMLQQQQTKQAADEAAIKTAAAAVAGELLANKLITASESDAAITKLATHAGALSVLSNLIGLHHAEKRANDLGQTVSDPGVPASVSESHDHLNRAFQAVGLSAPTVR